MVLRHVYRQVRENSGSVLDGIRWIRRNVFGGPAPARPQPNPAELNEVANQLAGNALVVANRSTIRRWLWWVGGLGGGLLGLGTAFWFMRRDGGVVAEIVNAVDGNEGVVGGGNAENADGGGDGGIDPGFLLYQILSYIGWSGGDTGNAGGDNTNTGA